MNQKHIRIARVNRERTEQDRRDNTARVDRMIKDGCPLHEFMRGRLGLHSTKRAA